MLIPGAGPAVRETWKQEICLCVIFILAEVQTRTNLSRFFKYLHFRWVYIFLYCIYLTTFDCSLYIWTHVCSFSSWHFQNGLVALVLMHLRELLSNFIFTTAHLPPISLHTMHCRRNETKTTLKPVLFTFAWVQKFDLYFYLYQMISHISISRICVVSPPLYLGDVIGGWWLSGSSRWQHVFRQQVHQCRSS